MKKIGKVLKTIDEYGYELKDDIAENIKAGNKKGKILSPVDKAMTWLDSGRPDNYIHRAEWGTGDEWNSDSIFDIEKNIDLNNFTYICPRI